MFYAKHTAVTVALCLLLPACGIDTSLDASDSDESMDNEDESKALLEQGITDEEPGFAPCGTGGPNLQNEVIGNAASPSGGAKQHNGSTINCTAIGVLQPTDDARYFCWTMAPSGHTWTFLRNVRTGVLGWTRDDLLRQNGSNRWCGF